MNQKNERINEGKELLNNYLKVLEKECNDFKKVNLSYQKACNELKRVFDNADRLLEIDTDRIALNLKFAFELGLQDNLNHFRNPKEQSFMERDYDCVLREKELWLREEYVTISVERQKILNEMTVCTSKIYEKVIEYNVFLETYIPKMAHYYGFMIANTTLKKALIGYTEDRVLSKVYTDWLSGYLDINLQ